MSITREEVWGDYSIEIQDYVNLGIAQQLGTKGGVMIYD